LLQSSLLALLFTRRIARRLPFFAALLAFYLIRSACSSLSPATSIPTPTPTSTTASPS